MDRFIRLPGCQKQGMACLDGQVTISARRKGQTARCPACGRRSNSIHSRYQRRPTDLAISDLRVVLELEVRRFRCQNQQCSRKTFAEGFPELVLPHAQRTLRLAELQTTLAIKTGGEVGSSLLEKLKMPVSGDTLLRLIRNAELPEHVTPKVLGVDDWSLQKGKTFGTILVDLEKHQVIDLLEERTAERLAAWLTTHPGVDIISRDRSPE